MEGEILSIDTAKHIADLEKENERLLELCLYALINNTVLYNRELAVNTKKTLINIIKENIDLDTYSIRKKLLEYWEENYD